MPEFQLRCQYSRKKKQIFFNDKEPREYYGFLIVNPQIIPTEFLHKKEWVCWLWISEDLIKRFDLNFERDKEYQFIVILGEKRTAKFTTNNHNKMVLSSLSYFESTVKKIGFWENENYFYEKKRDSKNTNNSPQDGNKNDLTKIFLFALPILLFFLFFFLIIKWGNKRRWKE